MLAAPLPRSFAVPCGDTPLSFYVSLSDCGWRNNRRPVASIRKTDCEEQLMANKLSELVQVKRDELTGLSLA